MRTFEGAVTRAAIERWHPGLALRAKLAPARTSSWGVACAVLDAAMLGVAALATELGARLSSAPSVSPVAAVALAGLSLALFEARGLYSPRLCLDLVEDVKTAVVQVTIAAMAVLSLVAVFRGGAGIEGVVRLWAFSALYVAAGRTAFSWSQAQARRKGELISPTLIVGTGAVGRRVARRLLEHRDLGLLPVGFVQPRAEASRSRDAELPIPVLGSTEDIDRIVEQFDVSQVVVNGAGGLVDEDVVPLLDRCRELRIAVALVPGAHEKITRRLRVEHVGGLPLITSYATDPRGWQFAVKYALDRVVAGALVVVLSPVLLACALVVLLSMGRPILFRQLRVGRDGEEFEMLKFRSMREGMAGSAAGFVPQEGLGPGGVEGQDRRTRLGTFLRKTSLDELPQLFDVLLGEMSLVGPRPERPEYVDQFTRTTYRYGERHRVKSGITGWAQVHGLRGRTSIADRAEWDNFYIENFSLWLDVKILVLTAVAVFRVFKSVE